MKRIVYYLAIVMLFCLFEQAKAGPIKIRLLALKHSYERIAIDDAKLVCDMAEKSR